MVPNEKKNISEKMAIFRYAKKIFFLQSNTSAIFLTDF